MEDAIITIQGNEKIYVNAKQKMIYIYYRYNFN